MLWTCEPKHLGSQMQRSSAEDESWSRDDMQNCWSWMAPTRGSGRPAISSDVPRLFDNMMLTRKQQSRETMQECRFSFIFLIVYFLWFLSPLTWLDVADPCGSQNLQHDSIKFNQWHAHFFEGAQPSTSQGRCSFPPSWDLPIWTETRSFFPEETGPLKFHGEPKRKWSHVKLLGCTKYSTVELVRWLNCVELILLIFILFWGDGNHHIVAHIVVCIVISHGIVISCYIIGG